MTSDVNNKPKQDLSLNIQKNWHLIYSTRQRRSGLQCSILYIFHTQKKIQMFGQLFLFLMFSEFWFNLLFKCFILLKVRTRTKVSAAAKRTTGSSVFVLQKLQSGRWKMKFWMKNAIYSIIKMKLFISLSL